MIAIEIIGCPFEDAENYNPWLSILPQLKSNHQCIITFVNRNNTINCFAFFPEEYEPIVNNEMKSHGYLIKQTNNSFTHYSSYTLIRKVSNDNKPLFFPFKTSSNQIKTLLSNLLNFSDESGFMLVINGLKRLSRKFLAQKDRIPAIEAMICAMESQDNYGIWCHAFSNNIDEERQIADLISSCIQGFQIKHNDEKQRIPFLTVPKYSDYTWKNEMAISATQKEINEIIEIFQFLGDYGIPRNRDTSVTNKTILPSNRTANHIPEIVIGNTLSEHMPIGIDLKTVRQNIFIAGAAGTGKGNLLFSLAKQLADNEVNFLFIESAKEEFHHMRKIIPSLQVWRPEPGGFVLNPFSIPEDLTYGEYNNSLQSILHTCFDIDTEGSALTRLFPDALEQCFFEMNYDYDSTNDSPDSRPFGINEFASTYSRLLDMQTYQPKDKQNIRQAGLNKIKSLYENRYVFDSIYSIPITKITSGFNVLQLSPLGSTSSKQFFVTLLLIQINAWLRARFRNNDNKDLKLVIAIDESHNLFQKSSNSYGIDFSFVKDFSSNLLEHRSSGIGYIIADQSAKNLPSQIIQSCASKVFLGANLDSGIKDYSLELYMSEEQLHNLYSFKEGDGVFLTYGMEHGVYFHTDDVISDLKVYKEYAANNDFLSKTRITIETYQECVSCPMRGKCDIQKKKQATMLAERYYFQHRDDILAKYFKAKAEKKEVREIEHELIKTTQNAAEKYDEATYCCFIQQLLRHYNREYSNMIFKTSISHFIQALINHRRKRKANES